MDISNTTVNWIIDKIFPEVWEWQQRPLVRVEPEIKEQAEKVLDCLGIPMSNAVSMFLRQVVLQRGIPFDVKLPADDRLITMDSLTKEQLYAELEKGMEDIKAGRVYSADEVEEEIRRELDT